MLNAKRLRGEEARGTYHYHSAFGQRTGAAHKKETAAAVKPPRG